MMVRPRSEGADDARHDAPHLEGRGLVDHDVREIRVGGLEQHRAAGCCDGCDRTSEYAGKVGPDPHPLDGAEMWLCPTCKADPLRSSPRPSRKPTPRRRRSVPDLPQAEMLLLGPAVPTTMGPAELPDAGFTPPSALRRPG